MTDDNKEQLPAEVTAEPRIVSAVLSSSNHGNLAQGAVKSPLAMLIQHAMSNAVKQALEDGVTMEDADEMRARMLDARQKVKEWFAAVVAAEAKKQQEIADGR